MNVVLHKRFDQMASKLPPKVKQKMVERISQYARNPHDAQMRVHALYSPYDNSFSINITADYLAIYVLIDNETALFTHIGTHSQLYG